MVTPGEHVLMIVRLQQAGVIATLQAQGIVTSSVGPTSPEGWTTVWSDEIDERRRAEYGAEYLAVDETQHGIQVEVRLASGVTCRQTWSYDTGMPSGQGEALGGPLADLFGHPDRQQAVEAVLHLGVSDPEEFVEALAALLDLPALFEPAPDAAVIAYRGEPAIAQLAAAIAGPALVGPPLKGWSILVPSRGGEVGCVELAAGLSGAARRRDAVLEVWRAGSGCGWSLWRRGQPVAGRSWNVGWWFSLADADEEAARAVRLLVKAVKGPADQTALRSLLQGECADGDPLAQFVAHLGLTPDLLLALDQPVQFARRAGVQEVARTPARRAVLDRVVSDMNSDRPPRWPLLSVAYALGTVAAAACCIAMTAVLVAVLVTDGAFWGAAETTREDWAALAVFALLSVVLVPTARYRIRRVIRQRRIRAR